MHPTQSIRVAVFTFSVLLVATLPMLPNSWWGSRSELRAEDQDGRRRGGGTFLRNFGNAIQNQQQNQNQNQQQTSPRSNRNDQRFNPNFGNSNRVPHQNNNNNSSNNQPKNHPNNGGLNHLYQGGRQHWLNGAIQGLDHIESHEDRHEHDEERLGRLWGRGRISYNQYDTFLNSLSKRLGTSDHDYGNYQSGWEHRHQQYQQLQQNSNWNVEQKKLGLEYVKYGDRPLEAEKGLVPKPNPLLEKPQVYDAAAGARLAQTINNGIKDDVSGLRKTLPEGCRTEDAVALVEKLKSGGSQPALIDNLQAALVERDVRRFERNAQALLVEPQQIQRLLIGLTLENLQDKLEDNASVDQIAKITEPMVRRVDQAGLDAEFSTALATWLQSIPEMLKTQQQLASGKIAVASAWPEGDVRLLFDPQLTSGETRLLPGGMIAAGGDGEARVLVGSGNKYTANGLPILKGAAPAVDTAGQSKPELPALQLHYPEAGSGPLKYTITCYQEVPSQTPGKLEPKQSWKQDYTIKPGLKQPLELAWNGRLWYEIACHSKDGTGPTKTYSLKPPAGHSPTYEFHSAGNFVTLVSAAGNVTLDNSLNARPFQFMLGNEYQTIRPGAKTTFPAGVTLQYARNGKTQLPKDAKGQPVADATPECTDISTITLNAGETGVIGVNSTGNWQIRSGDASALQIAERKPIKLPIAVAQQTNGAPAPMTESTTPRGTLYVLAIGVAKYQNAKDFPTLSFADKDVAALAKVLQEQKKSLFLDVQPVILTNEQATAIKIRTELVGLERKVTKNDTVALILSGHGVVEQNAYYFCPHDTDATRLSRQGISCSELQKVTDNLSARNVFVFLDSCCSGGAANQLQEGFDKQVTRVGNSGVVIFASSKGTESSQEDKAWGHGALTKAFLDTIANPELDLNKDSIVQVAELDQGLTEGVKNLTGGGQHVQTAELGTSIRNLSLLRFSGH